MARNILLIEDEPNVAAFIKKGLEEQNYTVLLSYDGQTGLDLLGQKQIDLVILDIILPDISGIEICQKIRQLGYASLPILMLTALGTTENIVEGLNIGADDYLVKPFKFKELVARLEALGRRGNIAVSVMGPLTFFDLELDREAKTVIRAQKTIRLTSTEFRLLEYLMLHKNKVLSRMDILENVWDIGFNMGTNVVDVYINYLRNKIDKGHARKLIHTVIGMGYIMRTTEDHED